MEFGIPKEVRDLEMRVGLTPAGVLALVQAGHTVYIERNAGLGAGFNDEHYRTAGAQIVYSAAEAYGRAEVVLKVARPTAAEHQHFRPGQTIFSFLHLSVSSPDLFTALKEREITAVAYEMMEDEEKERPILLPLSEIAGRLTPVIAGQLLMSTHNGRGILLSGIPGVPPAAVVILGGGVLGVNAARAFLGMGTQVTVLDADIRRLQHLDELFSGRITTMIRNKFNVRRATRFADVLVGCVQTPGRRTPTLVSRNMVRHMRSGSVIIDLSIDQGGCVETSRPTTLRNQTYVTDEVIHYCVPNITAVVSRTASYALTNAMLPYLHLIGEYGLLPTTVQKPELRQGINLYQGQLAHLQNAGALGHDLEIDLVSLLPGGEQ